MDSLINHGTWIKAQVDTWHVHRLQGNLSDTEGQNRLRDVRLRHSLRENMPFPRFSRRGSSTPTPSLDTLKKWADIDLRRADRLAGRQIKQGNFTMPPRRRTWHNEQVRHEGGPRLLRPQYRLAPGRIDFDRLQLHSFHPQDFRTFFLVSDLDPQIIPSMCRQHNTTTYRHPQHDTLRAWPPSSSGHPFFFFLFNIPISLFPPLSPIPFFLLFPTLGNCYFGMVWCGFLEGQGHIERINVFSR